MYTKKILKLADKFETLIKKADARKREEGYENYITSITYDESSENKRPFIQRIKFYFDMMYPESRASIMIEKLEREQLSKKSALEAINNYYNKIWNTFLEKSKKTSLLSVEERNKPKEVLNAEAKSYIDELKNDDLARLDFMNIFTLFGKKIRVVTANKKIDKEKVFQELKNYRDFLKTQNPLYSKYDNNDILTDEEIKYEMEKWIKNRR
jgi:hypothetical protein